MAQGHRCGSTSGRRPASARRSRCSARAFAARERGTDVVIGVVETHGRDADRRADARPRGRCPRSDVDYRGTVLRRDGRRRHPRTADPTVVLVDEFAHTNAPGSPQREAVAGRRAAARRRHRRDLDAQHPAPRVAERRRRADHRHRCNARRCPTTIVRRADQLELVDMTPEAIRRRMAHGNIYPADRDRRRAGELLPARQPRRAPRAGAAVGRRSGRGVAARLPRRARHRRRVGDARAGRRRHHRRRRVARR